MSGLFNCKTAYGEKCPAFPYDALRLPGSVLSNNVTSKPFLIKKRERAIEIVKDKIASPIIGIGINVNSNLEDLELVKDKLYTSLFIELREKTNRENLLKNIVEKIDDIIQKQEYQ